MLCIKCGGTAQIGRFCRNCYATLHPIVETDKLRGMKLRVCTECGRHMHQGHWGTDINRTVSQLARARATGSPTVTAECTQDKGMLTCILTLSQGPLVQSHTAAIRLEKTKCNTCGLRTEYFEAILQLRHCSADAEHYAISDIRESKMLTMAVPVGRGTRAAVDLYLKSTDYMLSLVRRMRKRYPGTVTISRKLHGRDKMTSKTLYRTTVLFRQ